MKKNTVEEEMIIDRDADTNGENEKETGFPFLGLLAMMSFRSLPEDYWEKEGIGWK